MSDPLPQSLDFAFSEGFSHDHANARERFIRRIAGFDACKKWPDCQCSRACDAKPFRPKRGWQFWLPLIVMAGLIGLALSTMIRGFPWA